MEFSKYLSSQEDKAKMLIKYLSKDFEYVSILGNDISGYQYLTTKYNSSISETSLKESGFVVRVNNGYGFYEYSFNFIKDDVKEFAKEIINKLRVDKELLDMMIKANKISDEPLIKEFSRDSDLDSFSSKDLVDYSSKLKDEILALDKKIVNATVLIRTTKVSKFFISKNRFLKQSYPYVNAGIFVTYVKDNKPVVARSFVDGKCLKDSLGKLATLKEEVYSKAKHLSNAKPIVPGYYDVITAPSITGLIAHEAFGHGVEMDQFVKDRALAKGYVGKYVASPIVNMKDGANSTFSVASYFFDDDGVLAGDTKIIKDGILVSGICDFVSANELDFKPTGNSRRQAFDHKAYARMTNTFIEKGNSKLSDMISSIKHGYMLFETNNGMEDPKNWNIQCVCEYGIEIIDGKLTDNYVSPVVMSGNVLDLLKSITMVSDDFEISGTGMCGKGYKEWVTVSDGGPALKAKVKLA